jgi:hypothetical protein
MTTTSTHATTPVSAPSSPQRPSTEPEARAIASRSGSSRRASGGGKTRQSINERLRDRRAREEQFIIDAAGALARRGAAQAEIDTADTALHEALAELETMGFSPTEVAAILDVPASELGSSGAARGTRKRRASSPAADAIAADDRETGTD